MVYPFPQLVPAGWASLRRSPIPGSRSWQSREFCWVLAPTRVLRTATAQPPQLYSTLRGVQAPGLSTHAKSKKGLLLLNSLVCSTVFQAYFHSPWSRITRLSWSGQMAKIGNAYHCAEGSFHKSSQCQRGVHRPPSCTLHFFFKHVGDTL